MIFLRWRQEEMRDERRRTDEVQPERVHDPPPPACLMHVSCHARPSRPPFSPPPPSSSSTGSFASRALPKVTTTLHHHCPLPLPTIFGSKQQFGSVAVKGEEEEAKK